MADIVALCSPNSIKAQEKIYSAALAGRYVAERGIPGDVVECGVWRGRCAMAMALALRQCVDLERRIYLYDTFEGMSAPTTVDRKFLSTLDTSAKVRSRWDKLAGNQGNSWKFASVEEVRQNMNATGYPEEKLVFVKGMVENTIPATVPDSISILRLDTDFFESTYHELVHLYPRLSTNGVLILDDYAHWVGSREAVDKYFAENGIRLLLTRVNSGARMAIKA